VEGFTPSYITVDIPVVKVTGWLRERDVERAAGFDLQGRLVLIVSERESSVKLSVIRYVVHYNKKLYFLTRNLIWDFNSLYLVN